MGAIAAGATSEATDTVYYAPTIIPEARQPASSRGGKSMIYSIMLLQFCPHSNLLGGLVQKYGTVRGNLRKLGACFAGKALPALPVRAVRAASAVLGMLWSGASYAGAAAVPAVTVREWWAMGVGFFGAAVLCWLCAGIVVVLGRLGELFEGKPPGVINVTPPDECNDWLTGAEKRLPEPAVLVEQSDPCYLCLGLTSQEWCTHRSASKAGAK